MSRWKFVGTILALHAGFFLWLVNYWKSKWRLSLVLRLNCTQVYSSLVVKSSIPPSLIRSKFYSYFPLSHVGGPFKVLHEAEKIIKKLFSIWNDHVARPSRLGYRLLDLKQCLCTEHIVQSRDVFSVSFLKYKPLDHSKMGIWARKVTT